MQRYFIDEAIQVEQQVTLTGETAHHMLKVMRMQPGHRVELVTPDEQAFISELTELDATDKTVTVTVQSPITKSVELPRREKVKKRRSRSSALAIYSAFLFSLARISSIMPVMY
ncbi:MAG: hypothetical protein LIR10_02235, partial [Bacillota bacterium]|nr:hypothetical protein [Bacillota bacterium]